MTTTAPVLSVRDASRYEIATAFIVKSAKEQSPDLPITPDTVAGMLENPVSADRIRASIEHLADQASGYLRNTPPHRLTTEGVLRSREQEFKAFNSANNAVLMTLMHGDLAIDGDELASHMIKEACKDTFRALDEMPGSASERNTHTKQFVQQVTDALGDPARAKDLLREAENNYLAEYHRETTSLYAPALQKSDDNDFSM